jgi:tetratricopeptide (TPR) repeat protein
MQAAEWDPDLYAPHLDLAKLALLRQDRDLALKHVSQAKLLAPREYSVLYSLQSVYRQLGNTAQADRIQEDLKLLRANSAARPRYGPWPAMSFEREPGCMRQSAERCHALRRPTAKFDAWFKRG